jgi:mitochondrial fission protein ELM1
VEISELFYYSRGVVSSAKPLIELYLCHIVKSKYDQFIKSRPTKDMKMRDYFNYMTYVEKLLKTPIEEGRKLAVWLVLSF